MNNIQTKKILDEMTGWEIIADNGGGLTLSIAGKYQHAYDDPTQLYRDLLSLAADGIDSVGGWDGNELCLYDGALEDTGDGKRITSDISTYIWIATLTQKNSGSNIWICPRCGGYAPLEPTEQEIRNGRYRVYTTILSPSEGWGGADTALWEMFKTP